MSVWCSVSGGAERPYKDVSIRKLVEATFNEHGPVAFYRGVRSDQFSFIFCDEGLSAAKAINIFCSELRANRIRADITAEIRFLT